MRRKRTHAGATPVKRDGKVVGYRAQVIDPLTGKKVSACSTLGLKGVLYQTPSEASAICDQADELLAKRVPGGNVTVEMLRERWLGKGWKKESSERINAHRTREFCELHAERPAALITEQDWFDFRDEYDAKPYQLEGLKAMFNWGASSHGGRVIPHSPFSDLDVVKKGDGNTRKNPPSIEEVDAVIDAAEADWPPFGAWLEFAAYTGARPGEIDGLKWTDLSDDGEEIRVRRQWSASSCKFTLPKNGQERIIRLNTRAKEAIEKARPFSRRIADACDGIPPGEFIFVNRQGAHFRHAARQWYWGRCSERVTWERETPTLYLSTRHFAGWFMLNRLRLTCEDIAVALGHTDRGTLVRKLYGHLDEVQAKQRIADAYAEHDRAERAKRKGKLRKIDGGQA